MSGVDNEADVVSPIEQPEESVECQVWCCQQQAHKQMCSFNCETEVLSIWVCEPLCEREQAEEVLSIESGVASNEHMNSCACLDYENDVMKNV